MIVIGNKDFVNSMKLAGLTRGYIVNSQDDIEPILNALSKLRGASDASEILLINSYVLQLYAFDEFETVVSIPDSIASFDSLDDLQSIVQKAIGQDLQLEDGL